MKTHLMIVISEAQKDALGVYAMKHDRSIASVVREAIASQIGYDFSTEVKPVETRGRPRKYATDEERKNANKVRAAAQRQLVKQLLSAYRSGEHYDSIQRLGSSLQNKE